MNALEPKLFQSNQLLSRWQMYEIEARAFVMAIQSLMAIERVIPKLRTHEELHKDEAFVALSEHLKNLKGSCQALSAKLSVVAIERLQLQIANGKTTLDQFRNTLKDIRERLIDELEETKLFVLDREYQDYYHYGTVHFFGFSVSEKFSAGTEEDLEEAGKCLAVARGTACVFHLMRSMEAVVQKLGDKLKVTIIDKNAKDLPWGIILANMNTAVQTMPLGVDRDRWSESCTLLHHVKQTWRNDTMHPKETYTTAQAKEVMDAVLAFLRQLATLV